MVVSKRTFWTTALMVMAGVAFPLYAQEPGAGAARLEIIKWSLIAAGFPLGLAKNLKNSESGRSRNRVSLLFNPFS